MPEDLFGQSVGAGSWGVAYRTQEDDSKQNLMAIMFVGLPDKATAEQVAAEYNVPFQKAMGEGHKVFAFKMVPEGPGTGSNG